MHGSKSVSAIASNFRGRLGAALGTPKLSSVMSILFVCLSIPILIFILLYNYRTNSAAIAATLREQVARTNLAGVENTQNLMQPAAAALQLLATATGTDPDIYRLEESRELLYRVLTTAPQIDAAYVSFEDGYHRVVTRIDDDRRRSDPRIPQAANWHSSYIDDFSAGQRRLRHRLFYDRWPHEIGGYDTPTTLDIRKLPGYQEAKASKALAVTQPAINPDTGYPIISVRVPIVRKGEFIGCASVNITLDILSSFLARHRTSANSVTMIADLSDATIIAHSIQQQSVRVVDGKVEVARLDNIADGNVREAFRQYVLTKQDNFLFRSPVTGDEMTASFTRVPESFLQSWSVVNVTPTNDFIGALKATNRQMVVIMLALTGLELILMYFVSARLARPIELVSRELKSVENLSFDGISARKSSIGEIAQLQSAAALLRNSLQSFSSFVPLDVVRGLIRSGTPLALGVQPKFLTVFFSDLENFSTQAERLQPDDLLTQLSAYFEDVSRAIAQEQGTIDKFSGDGIMAFWGAPAPQSDHVLRACRGAVRAARRMERLNHAWNAEGRPKMPIRIGLNCANVLVGNVGSSQRLSYTVMGDGVNVAARLEGINKTFGTTICISDSVFEAVEADILARPLRKVQVKGRKHEFMIYELLGIRSTSDPELVVRDRDARLSEMTWEASRSFELGDFAEATRRYQQILDVFPDDPVAKSMLDAVERRPRPVARAVVGPGVGAPG
jgi:class 3 adenylate cyclase